MDASLSDLKVAIIAAVAENGAIGKKGSIPWRLKSDLERFERITMNHAVIMGRRTFESILRYLGHPLRGRISIVLTRNKDYGEKYKERQWKSLCVFAQTWEQALSLASSLSPLNEVFIIGGEEIYSLAMPYTERMYITQVHAEVEADSFFPEYTQDLWELKTEERHKADSFNDYDYTYRVLVRKEMKSFVNLENARNEEQLMVMKKIQEQGVCPFCPENYSVAELKPIIRQGEHWHVRENRWPYENTRIHLLIIHNRHIEKLSDISDAAAQELFVLAKWAEEEYKTGGGLVIGMRFGGIGTNSASVNHLHAHFMASNITDREDPGYVPLRFRIG